MRPKNQMTKWETVRCVLQEWIAKVNFGLSLLGVLPFSAKPS